jgi:hypothetical protein
MWDSEAFQIPTTAQTQTLAAIFIWTNEIYNNYFSFGSHID